MGRTVLDEVMREHVFDDAGAFRGCFKGNVAVVFMGGGRRLEEEGAVEENVEIVVCHME